MLVPRESISAGLRRAHGMAARGALEIHEEAFLYYLLTPCAIRFSWKLPFRVALFYSEAAATAVYP